MEASALSAPQAHRLRISISAPLLRLRSDEQLVALFRAGNEDAFRTIHDRYRARLYAYVRQMLGGSKSDAEDALQDVFLRAYSALRANGREIALRAWLYRVAHNRCIDQLRRPVPQAADVFDVSRTPVADDPSTATERREELRRLVEDVRRLPEQQRSVLLMREMEGLSYADLAAALDISIPAVKSLLVRARMGLVQAAEARDTACFDVRLDLAAAHGRGVRANGRARRHLRDCAGCRAYRGELRGRQKALAGLSPVAGAGPLSVLAQLVGGSGAAGGGAVAGGGGAVVGGSAAAASATKLAIVVGAAVVTAGGAVEVRSQLDRPVHVRTHPSHVIAAAPRNVPAAPTATSVPLTGTQRPAATTGARAITAATPTPVHAHRGEALDKATVVDPADRRPDIVAPGPNDEATVVSSTATAPASSTSTPMPVTRQVPSAVDSVPKVLPATTPSAQAQAPTTPATPSTAATPPATTGASSSGSTSTQTATGSGAGGGATASGATSGATGTGTGTGTAGGG